MTAQVLSPVSARRVFLTLTFTRWFPVGLIAGLITLLAWSVASPSPRR